MRKTIILLMLIMALGNVYSQGIIFEHSTYQEALIKANKENKGLFIDCYTTWCGPCKRLAKNVFVQERVGTFFNANFVNLKMDMESKEGLILKEKYKVKAFPTLLWVNDRGEIQHKKVGGCDVDHLIEIAKIALDSKNNWKGMALRYANGEQGEDFLYNYILMGAGLYVDINEAREIYFSLKKNTDLINSRDAKLIMQTVSSSSTPIFQFVLKNKEKFNAVLGTNEMSEYLEKTMSFELIPLVLGKKEKEYLVKRTEILKIGKKIGRKVVASMDMNLLRDAKDQQKYYNAMVNYALKYELDNSDKLNQFVREIVESKVNFVKEVENKALRMAKRSIKLNSNSENKSAYNALLNKFGRKQSIMK